MQECPYDLPYPYRVIIKKAAIQSKWFWMGTLWCAAMRLAAGPLADISGKRAKEVGLAFGIQVVDLSPGGHAAAFDVRADQLDDQRPRSRMNALHPDRLRAECRAPGEGRASEAG